MVYDAADLGLVIGEPIALYLEAVNPTRRTIHHDAISVTASVASDEWTGALADQIYLRGTNTPGDFPATGTETEYECDGGRLCAVDDLEAFVGLTLEDGGVRSIDVLANDHYEDLDPLPISSSGYAWDNSGVLVPELNIPEGYDPRYWYQNSDIEGTYEFGNFEFDSEFGSYSVNGDLLYFTYVGEMILRAQGRPEVTFSAVASTVTNRDYNSPDYWIVSTSISATVQTDFGSHQFLITFDDGNGATPDIDTPTSGTNTGTIQSWGIDIIDYTQPRHGTATPAFTYTPDEGTKAAKDSFTYTIATLLGEQDTATVTILADPDRVSVEAIDDTAAEVPLYSEIYDEATLRFSRQDRPEEPIGNRHSTTVYFAITTVSEDDSREAAGISDFRMIGINTNQFGEVFGTTTINEEIALVYSVTIPVGEIHKDITLYALQDQDYELNEFVLIEIVDEFERSLGESFEAKYKIGNAKAAVTIVDLTADIDIEKSPGVFADEEEEDVPGVEIDLGLDRDELPESTFRSLIPDDMEFRSDFFTLSFDPSILNIWQTIVDPDSGKETLEVVTSTTQFEESDKSFSVWVEGFALGQTLLSVVWHESPLVTVGHVFDSVFITTVGLRDVDILLAIDGTGSNAWLDGGAPGSPGGTGKTVEGNRWLSHLRNWTSEEINFHYGDGPEDPEPIYVPGPDARYLNFPYTEGAFATDVPEIIDDAYEQVSTAYWTALATGAEPKVDILGMSRGGLIASEVAWRIKRDGYYRADGNQQTDPYNGSIRFLGLYDPVDQTNSVDETRYIPSNVEFAAAAYATNFMGNDPTEISRYYWDRIYYSGVTVTKTFAATHSAIQGAPTYSTDAGSQTFGVLPGNTNHPSAWLDGYTDAEDVAGSIVVDLWFRSLAKSLGAPITPVDDYHLDCLHPDPNDESPNHETGYCSND